MLVSRQKKMDNKRGKEHRKNGKTKIVKKDTVLNEEKEVKKNREKK